MELKQTFAAKRQNWAYLIFLCAAGFFVVSRKTSLVPCAMAYPLLGTLAMPGYVLLLGRKSREWYASRKRTLCAGLGMIALGYLQKVLVYWAQVLLNRDPAFYPFSTGGAAWLFLVTGCCLLLAGLWRDRGWSRCRLLGAALGVGLLGGLIKPFDSFLCLGQLCAYLPFFVVGRQLEEEQIEDWAGRKKLRFPALAVLAAAVLGCAVLYRKLKVLWPIVDGEGWYGACKPFSGGLLPLGMVFRLGWYAAALLLLWALFCLMPDKKLPLVTDQGKRTLSGYFWFMPLAYLTIGPLLAGFTLKRLLLAGGLSLGLLLLAPCRKGEELVLRVIDAPWLALTGRRQPERLSGSSFYQRHKWAIDMTLLFTAAFAVAAVAFLYPFDGNGKSLIWNTDGMEQQYPMMFYCKEYLLGGLRSLLETGKLSFPQWDFSLGFGMSPMDALRREPFMLLSLLGNEETMEYIAGFTTLLRLYVCGLTFLWFCVTLGKRDKLPVLMGAMVYVFSGYTLFAAPRQPYFVTVLMTYLLLTLIGTERFLQKRKYGMFVFAVFLQVVGDYYFAYINGLILAVYLLIRLGCRYGKDIRRIVGQILKLIGLYAWGAAMAMVTLLPGIASLASSARSQGDQDFSLFYSNHHYKELFTGLNLEFGGAGDWTFVSLAAIGWLACVLLFLRRNKERKPLKIGLIACFVFLCFPIFGLIANGFAYVCNRWCFAVPLLVGLILVEMAPDFLELSGRDKAVLLTATLLYSAVVITRPEVLSTVRTMGLVVLCMTALVILVQDQIFRSKRLRMGILAVVTVLTVMFNTAVSFLPGLGGYVNLYESEGQAYTDMAGSMAEALTYVEGEEFYRVAQKDSIANQGMGLGYNGVTSYYSVSPQGLSDYCADLCLSSQYQTFRIYGLDDRTAPYALASVKYYLTNSKQRVPYGFEEKQTLSDGKSVLYENAYTLPLGYTYTSYLTQAEYEQLAPLEKQQVMLEGAVLGEETGQLSRLTSFYREEKIPCQITKTSSLTVDEEAKRIDAEKDSSLKLEFEGKPNCETYVVLKGLRYADSNSSGDSRVICAAQGIKRKAALRGQNQSYYFQRDAVVFNLGYGEKAQKSCTLSFSKGVKLDYDAFYVVCIPMDDYAGQISQLREVTLENVSEQGDRITGTIDLEESRLLALSIPYAPGWKAYVNGREQELLQVNVMYCGLLLEPGSYEIELRYEHPGQQIGTMISAAAILAIVPVAAVSAWRRKKRRAGEI